MITEDVIATMMPQRFQLSHEALAELCRVHRSTVTSAIREVRLLMAVAG